ncbi:hypothetical protein [Pseudomonas viridiflava]|uniref:hypothetical protein n=1 Tax=Pseudomonas viridiflava TaxID=33069 RepID=UPI000F036B32|nr:hypothetical protein [Pseudomonas viridiflava]
MDDLNCESCGVQVSNEDFEFVDDELDETHPLCPDCSSNLSLDGQNCEHCGEPAQHEVELGFLCDDHYEEYVDGALRD